MIVGIKGFARCGKTIFTQLLATYISNLYNKPVLIFKTVKGNDYTQINHISENFSLNQSPIILKKLLSSGITSKEEIKDYAIKLDNNVYLFDLQDKVSDDESGLDLFKQIISVVQPVITIIDINSGIKTKDMQDIESSGIIDCYLEILEEDILILNKIKDIYKGDFNNTIFILNKKQKQNSIYKLKKNLGINYLFPLSFDSKVQQCYNKQNIKDYYYIHMNNEIETQIANVTNFLFNKGTEDAKYKFFKRK